MNCELQDLLKEDAPYWIDKLQQPPYNLKIVEDNNLILFKYNQIDSDFSNEIVQEARGIVFEKGTWNIVKHPFHKFFNAGELNAHKIDWDSAITLEKLDGSLITFYVYENVLYFATNGTINAKMSLLQSSVVVDNWKLETFFDLVDYTLYSKFNDLPQWSMFMKDLFRSIRHNATHLFEICTPYNRVVVPHKDFKLYYLNSKMNETGEEYYENFLYRNFPVPKMYGFSSVEECKESLENLPFTNEGYVVLDKNWNRIKIKNPAYLAIHRLKGEQGVSPKRIIELIQAGEEGEFLTYFPEYHETFGKYQDAYMDLIDRLKEDIDYFFSKDWNTRKEFAMEVKESTLPGLIFSLYDKKISIENWKEYLYTMNSNKMLEVLNRIMK